MPLRRGSSGSAPISSKPTVNCKLTQLWNFKNWSLKGFSKLSHPPHVSAQNVLLADETPGKDYTTAHLLSGAQCTRTVIISHFPMEEELQRETTLVSLSRALRAFTIIMRPIILFLWFLREKCWNNSLVGADFKACLIISFNAHLLQVLEFLVNNKVI